MLKSDELSTVVGLLERRMEELRTPEELDARGEDGVPDGVPDGERDAPCRSRLRMSEGRAAAVSLYEEAMRTARIELLMMR